MSSMRGKAQKSSATRKLLDPDTLFHIAQLYERISDEGEAARYMELCLAQEHGQPSQPDKKSKRDGKATSAAASHTGHHDVGGDGDTEIASTPSTPSSNATQPLSPPLYPMQDDSEPANDGFGTGTTATTSRARLWLARFAFKNNDLDRAERLAEELCMDGFEVEEAKGLVREVRGKRESEPGHTPPPPDDVS